MHKEANLRQHQCISTIQRCITFSCTLYIIKKNVTLNEKNEACDQWKSINWNKPIIAATDCFGHENQNNFVFEKADIFWYVLY